MTDSSPDTTAQTAAADVVELVCHEEQLQVWTDELLADLVLGDYLREDMDYADKVDLHRAVASEIKRIVSRAFDHPEAAAEIARLRAEVDVAYAHGVTAGADAERKRLEPEIERLRAALRRLGSMETMTVPFFIPRGGIGDELKARITFARKAIGDE